MNGRRRVLLIIALALAVVMVAGRFVRQDAAYLNAHIGEIHDCRPLTA